MFLNLYSSIILIYIGTSLTDISKIIGAEWKKLTDDQKDVSKSAKFYHIFFDFLGVAKQSQRA